MILFPTAYAADAVSLPVLENLKSEIINPGLAFLFVLATLYFLWGVFKFIRGADSDKEREIGGQHIMYGLIGLFVMVSVYGIMWMLCNFVQCQ